MADPTSPPFTPFVRVPAQALLLPLGPLSVEQILTLKQGIDPILRI